MPSPMWCRPPSELCLGLRQWTGVAIVGSVQFSINHNQSKSYRWSFWPYVVHTVAFQSVQSYKGYGSELCALQGQFWQSPQARRSFNSVRAGRFSTSRSQMHCKTVQTFVKKNARTTSHRTSKLEQQKLETKLLENHMETI